MTMTARNHITSAVLQAGKFYKNSDLGNSYYCSKVQGDSATFVLLESAAQGTSLQIEYQQRLQDARGYVEVDDPKERERLKVIYDKLDK